MYFIFFMLPGIDKWFFGIVVLLAVLGLLIFFSASQGLLARESARFSGVLISQFTSLILGVLSFFFALRIPPSFFHRYAFYIFVASLLLTIAVFLPSIGMSHGGATRWILLGPFSLQPAEFLKLGFIFYFAAWLGAVKTRIHSFSLGFFPLLVLVGLVGFIMLKQPDTGTFAVIFVCAVAMFIAGGAPWKNALVLCTSAFSGILLLALFRPYVRERILVFLNPLHDPLGAGYQITQSLIAVGSGGLWGRGFGQSIQKFSFLPEPTSDSIFAIFSEEFGFVGGVFLIGLFVVFALRGFALSKRAPDYFSRLTIVGIVTMITGQAFLNIGSMLGIFPLTGLPLPFVSHGGTALIATLFAAGLVLNMSRHKESL